MDLLLAFAGLPSGIESIVVGLFIIILVLGGAFWAIYRLFSWVKSAIEHGVGMKGEE